MSDSELVPPDFDLEKALRARSSTPAAQRPRCPECEALDIRPKTETHRGTPRRKPGKYYCKVCNNHFDDPLGGEEVADA